MTQLIVILLVLALIGAAIVYWYVSIPILVVGGYAIHRWRKSRREAAEKALRAQQAAREAMEEANRRAWRALSWDAGPCSVMVSRFGDPYDAEMVRMFLPDTPSFRDLDNPSQAAAQLVQRVEHIGPQVVAEGIALPDAVHLKEALEIRGAKVKIRETAVRGSGGGRTPIPASVRREVWRRDEGKCVDCGSRERLEYDHIIAVANGGANTVRNIELRCETCNRKKGAKV